MEFRVALQVLDKRLSNLEVSKARMELGVATGSLISRIGF